jgi:FkbM family methyltransferase
MPLDTKWLKVGGNTSCAERLRVPVPVTTIKALASMTHSLIARSDRLTRCYLEGLGTLSRSAFPPYLSTRAWNSVQSAAFDPQLELRPRTVRVGSRTVFRLYPHLGEFDLEALFVRSLCYESDTIRFLESQMNQYEFVLEIGANVGIYTLFFAAILAERSSPRPKVYAFEPSNEAYRRLAANLVLNGVDCVELHRAAVGSSFGFQSFYEPRGHLTNGSLKQDFASLFAPEVRRSNVLTIGRSEIGALLAERSEPFLIKIDVEGAEPDVLDALSDLIRERSPDLLLEVLPGAEDQLEAHPALHGYTRFELTPSGAERRPRLFAASNRDWFLSRRGGESS